MLENKSLVYIDKGKGLKWLSSAKSNSQAIATQDLEDVAKIVKNFENPAVDDNILFRDGDFTPRDQKMVAHIYEGMVKKDEGLSPIRGTEKIQEIGRRDNSIFYAISLSS